MDSLKGRYLAEYLDDMWVVKLDVTLAESLELQMADYLVD